MAPSQPRPSPWPWPGLLVSLAVVLVADRAHAQVTTAVCLDGFTWANNDQGLSPCLLAANLLGSCYPSPPFVLTALDPNWQYPGPTLAESEWYGWNRCLCSMQVYNLLATCEDCQGRTWTDWAGWTQSCNSSFTGDNKGARKKFPTSYPSNVTVPSWVEYDSSLNTGGTFDPTVMERLVSGASSISIPSSSSTSASSSTTQGGTQQGGLQLTTPSTTPSSSPTPQQNASGPQANGQTGAIVGGVVGGLALVCCFAGALVWMVRLAKAKDLARDHQQRGGFIPASSATSSRHRFNKPMEEFLPSSRSGMPVTTTTGHSRSYSHSQSQSHGGSSGPVHRSPSAAHMANPDPFATPERGPTLLPGGMIRSPSHSSASHAHTAEEQRVVRERRSSVGSNHSFSSDRPPSLYGGHIEGAFAALPPAPVGAGGGMQQEVLADLARPDSYPDYRRR